MDISRYVQIKLLGRAGRLTALEWFGIYKVGQRVAKRFSDDSGQVFIVGDVSSLLLLV